MVKIVIVTTIRKNINSPEAKRKHLTLHRHQRYKLKIVKLNTNHIGGKEKS